MIRSTKVSLKFANKNKKDSLLLFIKEYRRVSSLLIDIFWELEKVPILATKDITDSIDTWLSSRAIQCCAKQSSGIVRAVKSKQNKRLFVYNKLICSGMNKKAKKLKNIIDNCSISKPSSSNIIPELDSRFVKFDFNNNTSFDCIVNFSSFGNKLKINIPIKQTKHFIKLKNIGIIKSGVRLSENNITFMFDIQNKEISNSGEIIGLDIGILNSYTLSNGTSSSPCKHGHNLKSIQEKLSRKKKGSKAFKKAQEHRKNYTNWSINQINFNNIKQLNIENIKNIRHKTKSSRYLSHWTYTEIVKKLELKCEELGVQINRISPTYTSQRCSKCGWTRKSNRKGKLFKCTSCNFTLDADLNAARNISFSLFPIEKKERLLNKNRKGFYWKLED